jgi:putative membrane protein
MRATHAIDAAARLRIEAAVVEAERHTAGEIVVVVVGTCDEYGSAGWRLGVAAAVASFLAVHQFAPAATWWELLGAQALGLVAGHVVARIDAVRRRLIPHTLAERRVAERARRCFAERGLTRTRGRTGILIFVALLERRVVVLADEGIHATLDPDESWEQVVARALDGLRAGRAGEGIEAAVRRCGEILARHVPAPARNLDELPDAVVLED